MSAKLASEVAKEFPARGPMQQFRLRGSTAFVCFRCQLPKKSKLVTVFRSDWDSLLCNGCYGRLLSIYEITAGSGSDDSKSEQLAGLLETLVSEEEARLGLVLSAIGDDRSRLLSPVAQRFLGSSEYVAKSLAARTDLEWSAAVIGLAKATEAEFVARLIEPLRRALEGCDLATDMEDKQYGRVAKYFAGTEVAPPELGAISMLLGVFGHSKKRAASSALLQALETLVSDWPYANWLLSDDGATRDLSFLTRDYRNRAAHLGELTKTDYEACLALVAGDGGTLWKLIAATRTRREVERAESHGRKRRR